MDVQAEISLYPLLTSSMSKPIGTFCDALARGGLEVDSGTMSTVLSGELGQVFDALKCAVAETGKDCKIVLVAKISNACPSASGGDDCGSPPS